MTDYTGTPENDNFTGTDGSDRFIFGTDGPSDNSADFINGSGGQDLLLIQGEALPPQLIFGIEHLAFAPAGSHINQVTFQTSLHSAFLFDLNLAGSNQGVVVIQLNDRDDFDASGITRNGQQIGDTLLSGGDAIRVEIYGNANANLLIGTSGQDRFFGSGGDDTIHGLGGGDIFDGYAGNATLIGGTGDDIYIIAVPTMTVVENSGEGFDTINTYVSLYLPPEVEQLTTFVGTGDLYLVGNGLDNNIVGAEGANLLIGGDGADTIYGNEGADSLFGEAGNDTLNGGDGIDYLVGGDGKDNLDGGADADSLYGGDGGDILAGGGGFVTDILVGGRGNDTLYANSGLNDYDLIDGGWGDDAYYVDTGDDLTFEAVDQGTDTVYADISNVPNAGVYLYANVENLVLLGTTAFGVGNELANRLIGSSSGNWLLGGAGDDTIIGQGGNDVLFGEAGSDIFVFEQGSGQDVIGDFNAAEDQIDLSDYNFASFAALQSAFVQVGNDGAIDLGGGNLIVLHNVTMATLNAGDFIL